jgi:hypothetical protein
LASAGDEDQLARIDQPEPRHEFLLGGDLIVDMRGAVDQVESGILKAAIQQSEVIVRRQLAFHSIHVRNNADRVNTSNIPKMIACSVVICRSLGRTDLQSNSGISEKYSLTARIASGTLFLRGSSVPMPACPNQPQTAMPIHTRQPMLRNACAPRVFRGRPQSTLCALAFRYAKIELSCRATGGSREEASQGHV